MAYSAVTFNYFTTNEAITKSKATSSVFVSNMIAKLEKTRITTLQINDQTQPPTMGETKTQTPSKNGQQLRPPGGLDISSMRGSRKFFQRGSNIGYVCFS